MGYPLAGELIDDTLEDSGMLLNRRTRRWLATGSILFLAGCAAAQPLAQIEPEQQGPSSTSLASADLIYASGADVTHIYIFSYPQGKLVRKFAPPAGTISLQGLCSDPSGNVYVTSVMKGSGTGGPVGNVYKYAHGGTKVLKTLTFFNAAPFGCSVDPTSGTLAISTVGLNARNGEVWTYAPGSNYGKQYSSYDTQNYFYCAYDGSGNLFVDGQGAGTQMYLNEVKNGSSQMSELSLNKYISVSGMGQLEWDGAHMTFEHLTAAAIYQLSVSGSQVKIVGRTRLFGLNGSALSTIAGKAIIVPTGVSQTSLGFWKYPNGGKPLKTLSTPSALFALTISVGSRQ